MLAVGRAVLGDLLLGRLLGIDLPRLVGVGLVVLSVPGSCRRLEREEGGAVGLLLGLALVAAARICVAQPVCVVAVGTGARSRESHASRGQETDSQPRDDELAHPVPFSGFRR